MKIKPNLGICYIILHFLMGHYFLEQTTLLVINICECEKVKIKLIHWVTFMIVMNGVQNIDIIFFHCVSNTIVLMTNSTNETFGEALFKRFNCFSVLKGHATSISLFIYKTQDNFIDTILNKY